VRIGFDAIELHYAHGYLRIRSCRRSPTSAPTPTAAAGEPHAVGARWRGGARGGAAHRLGARITGSDWRDDGLTRRRGGFRKALKDEAWTISTCRPAASPPTPAIRRTPGYNVPIAERVKREVGIATRVVGLIVTPKQAEAVVADGKADMVAMARASSTIRAGAGTRRESSAPRPRAPQYQRAAPKLWPGAAMRG
jgi:hypothetical protein